MIGDDLGIGTKYASMKNASEHDLIIDPFQSDLFQPRPHIPI
jgi:hypothetical protein